MTMKQTTNETYITELKEAQKKLEELFNEAYRSNMKEETRTDFTQKVTTYLPGILQSIGATCDRFSDIDKEERKLNEAEEREKNLGKRYYKTSDGWFDYYVNKDTGEKKFKLEEGDIEIDSNADDFSRE